MTRWWIILHLVKQTSSKFRSFNAKAETLQQKVSYKGLLGTNRGMAMVSGLYECWHHRQAAILYSPNRSSHGYQGHMGSAKAVGRPYEGELNFIPVPKDVGNVRNNYSELLTPLT